MKLWASSVFWHFNAGLVCIVFSSRVKLLLKLWSWIPLKCVFNTVLANCGGLLIMKAFPSGNQCIVWCTSSRLRMAMTRLGKWPVPVASTPLLMLMFDVLFIWLSREAIFSFTVILFAFYLEICNLFWQHTTPTACLHAKMGKSGSQKEKNMDSHAAWWLKNNRDILSQKSFFEHTHMSAWWGEKTSNFNWMKRF